MKFDNLSIISGANKWCVKKNYFSPKVTLIFLLLIYLNTCMTFYFGLLTTFNELFRFYGFVNYVNSLKLEIGFTFCSTFVIYTGS